ncbi:hypothetical protein RB594_005408 [Gaeumannomyces avenae]
MTGHINIHHDDDDDDDIRGAAELASQHAGNSGDVSLFSGILDSLMQKKKAAEIDKDDVDEPSKTTYHTRLILPPNSTPFLRAFKTDGNLAAAIKNHKKYFDDDEDDDDDDVNERNMGTAAAIQALKTFTGHGAADTSATGGAAAPGKSQFIGLALSEASKLFDKQSAQGKVSSGSTKESAVMQAGEMAYKIYLKSKGDAPAAGPGGGVGGLMDLMASKFMK